MREVKFRAWDNVKDEMYYVGEEENISFGLESNGIVAYDITEEEEEFKILHHLKYMQHTGLEDMNGNGIYEGDIVYQIFNDRIDEWHGFTGVVKQEEGVWWIDNEVDNGTRLWSEMNQNIIKGNKFENPELLQGGNK
ncbi:YopX family protein [Bacillus mycoides]|uniref:YopX family protein n=1 Tax=Bacillus mycoides TaxID=1405 RepID=UPI003D234C66